jgi:hypothetical protein
MEWPIGGRDFWYSNKNGIENVVLDLSFERIAASEFIDA